MLPIVLCLEMELRPI